MIKKYLTATLIVLGIDLTWLMVIMPSFYDAQLSNFARTSIAWSALLAWLLIPLGIVVFVDKVAKDYKQSVMYGAIYGLILYGLYEFTNYAILANWTIQMVLVDIFWGMFLCSVSSLLLKVVSKKWLK